MTFKRWQKTMVALSALAVLAGCAGPVQMTAEEQTAVGTHWNAPLPQTRVPSVELTHDWWAAWNDTELTALIDRAMQANTTVRTALANLRAAAALSDAATASLFPVFDASASGSKQRKESRTTKSFDAGGSMTWSWSLAGGNIAAQRAANHEAMASAMTLEDTKVAVASEVAQAYINLRLSRVTLRITKETYENADEASQIALWRASAGLGTQTEVEQALSNRESARAQIPVCEALIANYKNALARLCVLNADAVDRSAADTIPAAPVGIAVSIPAETLKQRPDMRSAELSVTAASERVYEARASWFPTLKITGNLGTQAATIGALGASGTGIAALVGALSMPILNWGEQVAATEQKLAALDKARATYTATLVKALEETENALSGISAAERRSAALLRAQEAAKSAADLALIEYRSGLTDYQTVLNTQKTLLTARESVQKNAADLSTNYVKLFSALGGGWKAPQTL